jgi:hypothetical protein
MRAMDVMTTNVITVDPNTREMGHRWSLRRARSDADGHERRIDPDHQSRAIAKP